MPGLPTVWYGLVNIGRQAILRTTGVQPRWSTDGQCTTVYGRCTEGYSCTEGYGCSVYGGSMLYGGSTAVGVRRVVRQCTAVGVPRVGAQVRYWSRPVPHRLRLWRRGLWTPVML